MSDTKDCVSRLAALVGLVLLLAGEVVGQDLTRQFDEYLSALAGSGFTGAALVARGGKVTFAKGYGLANEEFDIPNTPQTKFRIASITKQFTAASILLLQERGQLSVTDSICKYVDECPKVWEPIAIHHLLSHTSGIPDYTDPRTAPAFRQIRLLGVTPGGFVDSFKGMPLEFAPGEKFNYSNSGYFLLGYLIEKIAGQSYEAFLQGNIFGPLKMTNTGYDTHARILKSRATGYSGRGGIRTNSNYVDMSGPYAAGALYSTAEDLFAWNEALFSDRLLSAKSRAAMMTVNKEGYAYGLWMSQWHNRQAVRHGGAIAGFSTMLSRFPAEELTIVVLRNADYGVPQPDVISRTLAAIALGETYELPRD